uniref:Uncharacterized protein n=1 Tax=Octactis speculum TaxID=3111310 RepID=A0A7S2AKF4_9STRA|mmetsp:Transcript_11202/g.14819  ORF Transcript_11202/g.14819 Transcript_11202/m.14819 type:complete len:104 (+) Transcript_11202:31-342(+)|eukprot:CAMPEP_0185768816 /NCGR_PEP_ID=MMETSP1174-20130828/52318_1 /TAXON_ID=35687 /ORGANISM="Dictyocha speculum, Strain CCMP1381" /LENGTH=103 /DNA_ID=CAMNT_0028453675 /DNA_START=31 /DNA_END=342 /DNA_ORIENTATION=+
MAAFIQRVATWLANEILVKKLAENRSFQQFAVRTAETVEKITKEGVTKGVQEGISKTATTAVGGEAAVDSVRRTISQISSETSKYTRTLQEEIEKDLNKAYRK